MSLCSDFKLHYGLQTTCLDSSLGTTMWLYLDFNDQAARGNAEYHHSHCCILRPAEGPPWGKKGWIPLTHLQWPGKIKQPMKPLQILHKTSSWQLPKMFP